MEGDSDLLGDSEIHSNASLFLSSMICERSEPTDVTSKYESLSGSHSTDHSSVGPDETDLNSCLSHQRVINSIDPDLTDNLRSVSDFGSAVLSPLMPLTSHLCSSSSLDSDIPSTVIIVSRTNGSPQVTMSYTDSQIYKKGTSVIDISPFSVFTSPSLSSSFSMVCSTPSKSLSVPLMSSITPTDSLMLPSIHCPTPPISQSLVDLQPLSLVPPLEINQSSMGILSSDSPMNVESDVYVEKKLTNQDLPQASKSATAYDFSPSKESPPRSLKSMRRRPPPPPIGSYKNQKNYFSRLKISNLRRVVLEKSLIGKSTDSPLQTKVMDVKPSETTGETFTSRGLNSRSNEQLGQLDKPKAQIEMPSSHSCGLRETFELKVNGSKENALTANVISVSEDSQCKDNFKQSSKEKSTVVESSILSQKGQQEVHIKEGIVENSNLSMADPQELNKRKRGRPRKDESTKTLTDLKSSNAAGTSWVPQTAPKRNLNTIVTRHSVFRKSNNETAENESDDFSPPRKRTYKKKMASTINDLVSTRSLHKNRTSFSEDVHRCDLRPSNFQAKASPHSPKYGASNKELKRMEVSKKCLVILQGGFKKSREYLHHYIQTSQYDDILFPHITQDDVCMFKLANQFYKEHKDKSYDIFSHDDSEDELQCQKIFYGQNKVTEASLKYSFSPQSSTRPDLHFEKEKCESDGKNETVEVVTKRGRGRPRINRGNKEIQSVSESERKKKKLISSILRELGDQEDSRKTSSCTQNISTIISRETVSEISPGSCKQHLNPTSPSDTECNREVKSFVTFVTPKKHIREESSSVESTPLKKIRMGGQPSMFLQFGSESSSEKNFMSFESLISRSTSPCASSSQIIVSRPSIMSFAQDVGGSGSTKPEEQNKKSSQLSRPLPDFMDSKKLEDSSQREIGQDIYPKCSCKHVCGLQDTYLSSPFKRPPSQTTNPLPSRVDSRSSVLTISYPSTPVPQPFVYQTPFPAPTNLLAYDPHKHLIFSNASGDNLRDQQPSHAVAFLGGNAIRLPNGNLAQTPAMLCRHDNPNPMISLVMAPNGYGYYAIPMAIDEKMQVPPVNQQSQILVPCVVNGFSAAQTDGSKSSTSAKEVSADTEKSSIPPSPLQNLIQPLSTSSPSPRKVSIDISQSYSSSQLLARSSNIIASQIDSTSNKNSIGELNNSDNNDISSANYNTSILSTSLSYCGNEPQTDNSYQDSTVSGQFNQNLLTHRETPTMYFSTNGNTFGSSSNINVFSNHNANSRITHNYYEDCTSSTRYFHSTRNHYDRSSDPYNHPRVMLGPTQASHPSNHINNLEGFATTPTALHRHSNQSHAYDSLTPQFPYTSYANNIVTPGFGHHSQSFFGPDVISESNKRINSFGNHYRGEEHIQRLGEKTVQNGLNSSLWS